MCNPARCHSRCLPAGDGISFEVADVFSRIDAFLAGFMRQGLVWRAITNGEDARHICLQVFIGNNSPFSVLCRFLPGQCFRYWRLHPQHLTRCRLKVTVLPSCFLPVLLRRCRCHPRFLQKRGRNVYALLLNCFSSSLDISSSSTGTTLGINSTMVIFCAHGIVEIGKLNTR